MNGLSTDTIALYYNKAFMNVNMPKVWAYIDSTICNSIESVSVSQEDDVISQLCRITIANVNPTDAFDTGYYNHNRNDTTHNKPSNDWLGKIMPGNTIDVRMGYGNDTNCVFFGYIDTTETVIDGSGDAVINITCRDAGKFLLDGTINSYDVTSSEILSDITYPIDAGIYTTGYLLTAADTNPYLWQIWQDVCMRAGITYFDVGSSPNTDFPLRLDDLNDEYFEKISGTWNALTDLCCKLLNARMFMRGEIMCLRKIENTDYTANRGLVLHDYDWESLDVDDYYVDRAIESSIKVWNITKTFYYAPGVDYEYDEQTNSIRRAQMSNITNGQSVIVEFKKVNWIFKCGYNLYRIKQFNTHDDAYGTIVAKNDIDDLVRSINVGPYGDGSIAGHVNNEGYNTKILTEDLPELTTEYLLDNWLIGRKQKMLQEYWQVEADCMAVTQLQLQDLVQFYLPGTIAGIYMIRGFTINYSAGDFTMNIKGTFLANP